MADWNVQSKYKPEYCDDIIKFAKQGKTITAFCADKLIATKTVHNWVEKHEEFAKAHATAKSILLSKYEQKAHNMIDGELDSKGFNALKFMMSSNFSEYREKKEQTVNINQVDAKDIVDSADWE